MNCINKDTKLKVIKTIIMLVLAILKLIIILLILYHLSILVQYTTVLVKLRYQCCFLKVQKSFMLHTVATHTTC